MNAKEAIQKELKELDSNLPIAGSPVFSVPDGYFEGLATAILEKIKNGETSQPKAELEALSPLLASISKQTPYTLPSQYFEDNLQGITAVNVDVDSSVLAGHNRRMPYSVPDGYFDSLPSQILSKVERSKAKVVPLFNRSWMRVAAAAVVTGALVIGGFRLFNQKQADVPLASVPKQDSVLVAQTSPVIEKEIKAVPTRELEEFINDVVPAVSATKTINGNSSSAIKAAVVSLEDVTVNEMESFLSALPFADDETGGID